MLQTTPTNRISLPADLEEQQEDRRFFELLNRMVQTAYKDASDREAERTIQEAMMSGRLTSCYTPERVITPDRTMKNTWMKSAWFRHSAHLGLTASHVLSFSFGRPPDEDAGPYMEENENEVADLLEDLGQQAYLWTTSEKLTVFTARPSGTRFLPENIDEEAQESPSGLVFTPGADPGKIGKRLRCYSGAPGTFFDPQPSPFPELNLGGERGYRVKVRDSGTVGDGGGSCPLSIAREIMRLSGAPLWGDIIAFQIVVLAADYSFKGLINIIPDSMWNEEADMVIDAKSVNHQVHSTKVTVGKLMPTRQKKNKRHFYVEPMNLGEVVNRFISAEQLAGQVQVIAENLDRETWEETLARARKMRAQAEAELEAEDFEETIEETPEEWDSLGHVRRAVMQQPEEKNGLLLAHREAHGSPFGLPSITGMTSEGPANSWTSQLKRSRKKGESWNYEEDRPEEPTLSGIMVSGEKLLLMDPVYAGTTYPRRGYVRLVWHPKHEDQLIGIGLAKADTLRLRDAFDGMDVDGDKLQMIPMRDEKGTPLVLLMRSPMSIDGGACLRLRREDAKRLQELGYHFYAQTGEHKHPGLYRIEEDGTQAYPDVLAARPHENPPKWTTDPDLMVRRTLEITQYRGIMGEGVPGGVQPGLRGALRPGEAQVQHERGSHRPVAQRVGGPDPGPPAAPGDHPGSGEERNAPGPLPLPPDTRGDTGDVPGAVPGGGVHAGAHLPPAPPRVAEGAGSRQPFPAGTG